MRFIPLRFLPLLASLLGCGDKSITQGGTQTAATGPLSEVEEKKRAATRAEEEANLAQEEAEVKQAEAKIKRQEAQLAEKKAGITKKRQAALG